MIALGAEQKVRVLLTLPCIHDLIKRSEGLSFRAFTLGQHESGEPARTAAAVVAGAGIRRSCTHVSSFLPEKGAANCGCCTHVMPLTVTTVAGPVLLQGAPLSVIFVAVLTTTTSLGVSSSLAARRRPKMAGTLRVGKLTFSRYSSKYFPTMQMISPAITPGGAFIRKFEFGSFSATVSFTGSPPGRRRKASGSISRVALV